MPTLCSKTTFLFPPVFFHSPISSQKEESCHVSICSNGFSSFACRILSELYIIAFEPLPDMAEPTSQGSSVALPSLNPMCALGLLLSAAKITIIFTAHYLAFTDCLFMLGTRLCTLLTLTNLILTITPLYRENDHPYFTDKSTKAKSCFLLANVS